MIRALFLAAFLGLVTGELQDVAIDSQGALSKVMRSEAPHHDSMIQDQDLAIESHGIPSKAMRSETPHDHQETESDAMNGKKGLQAIARHAFVNTLKDSSSSGPLVGRQQRVAALNDVLKAFNSAGVKFVVGYGSALGIVREGDLLDSDDDVDFLVSDDTFHLAKPVVSKLRTDFVKFAGDSPSFYRPSASGWGPVDIYRVIPASDTNKVCVPQDKVTIPHDMVWPPKMVQPKGLPGVTVPVPNQPEKFLEYFYGADWKTPKQSKGTKASPMAEYDQICHTPTSLISQPNQTEVGNATSVSGAALKVSELVSIKALSAGLLLPLAGVCWLAWTATTPGWTSRLTYTWYDFALLGLYILLSSGSTLSLRGTNGSAIFMTIEACILLYVLKASLSLGLLVFKRSMSFATLIDSLRQKSDDMYVPVWANLALLGSLYAGYDAMSFFAIQHLPPASFQLLLQSRTLLLVPLQWYLLGRKINVLQLVSLSLIGVGVCALGVGDITALGSHQEFASMHSYLVGVAIILGKVVLSALALIVNEKLLKEFPLTVDAQNLVMYSFGMASLCVWFVCSRSGSSPAAPVQQSTAAVLGQIFHNPWMLSSVLMMTLLGLTVAYLLKAFSALEKELASFGVVALLAVGQALMPGEQFALHNILCALIITVGSFAYNQNATAKPK